MLEDKIKGLIWYKKIHLNRKMNEWNQVEAATRCLTYQKMYWLWENGKSYPKLANRKLIAKVYGVKVEEIFSEHDVVHRPCRKKVKI